MPARWCAGIPVCPVDCSIVQPRDFWQNVRLPIAPQAFKEPAPLMNRIVVFTSDPNFTVRKGIVRLLEEMPTLEVLVLVHRPPRRLKRLLRNQWRNLKRNGWRWIPYQAAEIADLLRTRWRRTAWSTDARPGDDFSAAALEANPRVSISGFANIHSAESLAALKAFDPDLGIALAAPILREPLFDTPRLGTINLHKGRVPDYRGMPPAFWELWNGEKSVGCTVHFVAAGLDTGDIIATDTINCSKFSTAHGMRLLLDELGIRMVCEVAGQLAAGNAARRPQQGEGKTYRKPTLAQVAALDRRLAGPASGGALRGLARSAAVMGYTRGLRPLVRLRNRLAKKREVVVLLYHRVTDELRDGVTVGIEQFDEQIGYLAKHYPIASIDDIVDGNIPDSGDGRPLVAVTFDDGYRDNFDHAVPVLLRHRVPAGFFVSTGMIGRDVGFEHDLSKLGRALPNMDWDQLRDMRDMGFTLGSHTVTHMNCATAEESQLKAELAESKQALESELGLDRVLFAYPFGGRSDITADALSEVKNAGYGACLSAYGGVNVGPIDRFNVLRMPVSSGFDFGRFVARVEGW